MLSTEEYLERSAAVSANDSLLSIESVALDCDAFAERISYVAPLRIVQSSDGVVSTVQDSDSTGRDFSRQSGVFELHTDGLYHHWVPDLVLLYCISAGNSGIPTTFVDTHLVMKALAATGRASALDEIEMVYTGRDGGEYPRSLVEAHPLTAKSIINLGARVYFRSKAGSALSGKGVVQVMHEFFEQLDSAPRYTHHWAKGDAVLFDNLRYVHGRGVSTVSGHGRCDRQLKRVWLARTDARRDDALTRPSRRLGE
jgi:alpha-ketoglutarate-dependent taurine dioxygenase